MFRLTQYLREILKPTPLMLLRQPTGPVVIWNLVRRCNLSCRHCYSISGDVDFPGELTTAEALHVMEDLRGFGVPALILSGGEPLMRRDLFALSAHAKSLGFHVSLSTNGTLIGEALADRIRDAGYDYVGISLDGNGATHDRFRGKPGAYDAALAALRRLRRRRVKVGVRFTMTHQNAAELPALLDLVERERFPKFYLSHLVYAGRGDKNRRDDAAHNATRAAMDLLIGRAWTWLQRGQDIEVVTGNNDADAVYLLCWVARREPASLRHLRVKLAQWGGNSSGVNVANIDNLGNVHPDTMWWRHSLGNLKERPFSDIWRDLSDPIMAGLRRRPRTIKGRCGACAYFDVCGGNTRVRALRVAGDPWAEDPGCYLTDAEVGLSDASRVTVATREDMRHAAPLDA